MSPATKTCQKTRLAEPSRICTAAAAQVPGPHGLGAPQQHANDEREPVRFDEADAGVRRAGNHARHRAPRVENAEHVGDEAARRGDQKKDSIGAEEDLSRGWRHGGIVRV